MVMIFQTWWYMCTRVDLSLMSIALRASFNVLLCFALSWYRARMVGGVDVERWYWLWVVSWCRATDVRNFLIDVCRAAGRIPV